MTRDATGAVVTTGADRTVAPQTALAHVAAVSFLAARASPFAGFFISLAGGVALARAGERLGARRGYGASLAALIQSVAVIGPARFGVPLTHALSAPLLGSLVARRVGVLRQILACLAIRVTENTVVAAFFIWVIAGGLDAYVGSYEAIFESLPLLPSGEGAALKVTIAGVGIWSVFASTVQVLVYRRGLKRWGGSPADRDDEPSGERSSEMTTDVESAACRRFDPRAVAIAAAIVFGMLLASTSAVLLVAVSAWLVLSTIAAGRVDGRALPAGLVLTGIFFVSGFGFALAGGLGMDIALRRGARAALLVLVATWLRAIAGSDGFREVSRRALGRLRAIPGVPEASEALEELGSAPRLLPAGRSLLAVLGTARRRPRPILDAVLGWVAAEAGRFRLAPGRLRPRVGLRVWDAVLLAAAIAPLAVVLGAVG